MCGLEYWVVNQDFNVPVSTEVRHAVHAVLHILTHQIS